MANQRSLMVRVNDRGPFADDRLIDVSSRAADILDFKGDGVAQVRVEFVEPARLDGDDAAYLMASYRGPELSETMVAAAPVPAPRGKPVVLASRRPFDPFSALSAGSGSTTRGFGFGASPPAATFSLRSSYQGTRVTPVAFQILQDFAVR
jgi:rare lipoprotein A